MEGEGVLEEGDDVSSFHHGQTGNDGAPYSRWYKYAALVFWPRTKRLHFLGQQQVQSLLEAAVGGDSQAHPGFPDVDAFITAALEAHGAALDDGAMLALLGNAALPREHLVSFIAKHLTLDNTDAVVPTLRRLLCGVDSIPGLGAAFESACKRQTIAGLAKACVLLCGLHGQVSGSRVKTDILPVSGLRVLESGIHIVIAGMQLVMPKYNDNAIVDAKNASTIVSSLWSLLGALGDGSGFVEPACTSIETNTKVFPALTVVAPAAANVFGVIPPSLLQPLQEMVAQSFNTPLAKGEKVYAVDSASLIAAFKILPIDTASAVIPSILSNTVRFPPLGTVLPALGYVLGAHKDRLTFCNRKEWPNAVLASTRHMLLLRYSYNFRNVETIAMALRQCALCDAAAATPRRISWMKRLQDECRSSNMSPATVIGPALAQYMSTPSVPKTSKDFEAFARSVIAEVEEAGVPLPPLPGRDWKIVVKLGCTCDSCDEASIFLRSPTRDAITLFDEDGFDTGHLAIKLTQLADASGGDFAITDQSKAHAGDKMITICKSATGRVPVSTLETHTRQTKERQKYRQLAVALSAQLLPLVGPSLVETEHPKKRTKSSEPKVTRIDA